MKAFETRRASEIAIQPEEQRWLIDGLWADQAVGVIGGEPKCYKSFLALDVAVSVASGAPCLRHFAPCGRGPVLLFAAEDALHVVRERLQGIAYYEGVDFDTLDVHVITAPTVRLDLERDRQRLQHTIGAIQPRLVVLDPFVRLHRIDENTAAEVAPLLAFLREMQRQFETAVLLVHHARKAAHARAGQALRGSSEIHAWGDSNLYLRRQRDRLLLSIEHRAAPSVTDLAVELRTDGDAVALHVMPVAPAIDPSPPPLSAAERIESALGSAATPLTIRALRAACRMRMATLCDVLTELKQNGQVVEVDGGYQLSGAHGFHRSVST